MNSDFLKSKFYGRSRRTLDANPLPILLSPMVTLTSRSQNTDIFHFDILFVNKFKQRASNDLQIDLRKFE
jgi:hypothetical protein